MAKIRMEHWHNSPTYRIVPSNKPRGYDIADEDKARYDSDRDSNVVIPALISILGVACFIVFSLASG